MTKQDSTGRISRQARLRDVPLGQMRVNPLAQRELRQARVDSIAANMDLEQIGTPTVNDAGGIFHILDGQHRIEAVKQWLGDGWETQKVQCWTYSGLTDAEEAEVFLKLNDTLRVDLFSKFKTAVNAGRPDESEIDRVVRSNGLVISRDHGGIGAVGALTKVYRRAGSVTLGRTLRVIRDAYGDAGMDSVVIDGIGLLCARYNGQLSDERLTERLGSARGGVGGLLNAAARMRTQTGSPRAQCVAAIASETYNRGLGSKNAGRLSPWWKAES